MKNRSFFERLGFAFAGIAVVARREKSFRSQSLVAAVAVVATTGLDAGLLWSGLVALAIAMVLALEAMNAALEYLTDHLHPERAEEIGHAKDAAAGAVLIASLGAAGVGTLMLFSLA